MYSNLFAQLGKAKAKSGGEKLEVILQHSSKDVEDLTNLDLLLFGNTIKSLLRFEIADSKPWTSRTFKWHFGCSCRLENWYSAR